MCPKIVPKPHTVVILFSANTNGETWCSSFTYNDHIYSDHICEAPKSTNNDSSIIFQKVIQLFCVMNRLNYTPFVMPSPAAFRSNMAPLQLRLTGNAWLLTTFLQNVPIHAFHCSFQVKWTLVAVIHQQLLFLFTQIMIRGIASNIYFLFFAQFLAQYCVLTIKHVYHSAWFVN